MRLLVSIVLLFLLPTGGFSLQCYQCQNQDGSLCTTKKTCSGQESKCVSVKKVVYNDSKTTQTFYKKCTKPDQCESWSINTNVWKEEQNRRCCNSSLCNNPKPPVMRPKTNFKKCYTCDWENCSKNMSCQGNEDRCITIYGKNVTKGCASKSFCNRQEILPYIRQGSVTCCSGYLCNGAKSVVQSFLFLCCSLISFSLIT